MSSVAQLPYVAPWQSGFERFSTQVYTPGKSGSSLLFMNVPDGQWWRLIYINFQFNTDATIGSRTVSFRVFVEGVNKMYVAAVGSLAPSTATTVMFGPGLTAFIDTADKTNQAVTTPIPDLLWPPRANVNVNVGNSGAGDTFQQLQTYAVEVYTEDYTPTDAPGVAASRPALVPLRL